MERLFGGKVYLEVFVKVNAALHEGTLHLLGSSRKSFPARLIMEEMGTPGEGPRPTSGRFCGGCRLGATTRRGMT